MTTLAEVQTLIDNTPINGVCNLPGGVVECPDFVSGLNITKSITISGNNTVFNLPVTGIPTRSFIKADTLPNGSYFEVKDLTINGPDTTGWASTFDLQTISAVSYQLYRTWDSKMICKNLTITGGFSYAISRAGGGKFEVKDCDLGGWVGALSFFESHGGWGDMILRDTVMRSIPNQKYSSIGMYIHPHLHLNAERVTAYGWKRYAIYLNGTPQSAGHHDLIEVEAHDCSLIQTGSSSITTLVRCLETGTISNGGSYFKGPVLSVESTWETTNGMIGFLNNNDVKRTFVKDKIRPTARFAAFGNGTIGKLELIACDVQLNGTSSLASIASTSTANIELNTVSITGNTTRNPLIIEGGTLKVINGQLPANCKITLPGVLV